MTSVLYCQPENYSTYQQFYKDESPKRLLRKPRHHSPREVHSVIPNTDTHSEEDEDETNSLNSSDSIYRCHDCGKQYKHPNCLTKHQWEHSEQWEYTSKFLLTKHQQVQMLEAASILMNMKSSKRKCNILKIHK